MHSTYTNRQLALKLSVDMRANESVPFIIDRAVAFAKFLGADQVAGKPSGKKTPRKDPAETG